MLGVVPSRKELNFYFLAAIIVTPEGNLLEVKLINDATKKNGLNNFIGKHDDDKLSKIT
tara:strand:- start:38 stop:214 length:177 start_codon:yes stop_codon:yes gene_type:complete